MQTKMNVSIGEASKQTRLPIATIRYYEEVGLLPQARRLGGGHRVYGPEEMSRLGMIARCRSLGFPLDQIRSLLAVMLDGQPCADVRALAEEHLSMIRQKRMELVRIERQLAVVVKSCATGCANGVVEDCSLILDLSGPTIEARR